MSGRRNTLTPPEKGGLEDPGAHDLGSAGSGSDDHFSDAQSAQARSASASPIPRTRVEKVSGEPSYGEVPGTEAYKKREGDAEPDEIAVIPDEENGRRAAAPSDPGEGGGSGRERPPTPGGKPIPLTVVEESAGGSRVHTHPEARHEADEAPDLRVTADGKAVPGNNATDAPPSPISLKSPTPSRTRRKSSVNSAAGPLPPGARSSGHGGGGGGGGDGDDDDDDAFGDDFDDFEEGGGDADFGDFDDGFQEHAEPAAAPPPPSSAPAVQPLSFPIPDFDGMDPDDIFAAAEPYLNALYPADEPGTPPLPPLAQDGSPVFLTPRSASLWSQLVAPPPLQPPDWIRSRIRRLFLVSLGVPVDLDEILPASKQKKLVLPSLRRAGSSGSLRTSTDSRPSAAPRRRPGPGGDANASSTSVDSQGGPSAPGAGGRRRKGPPPEPDLDLVAAKQLCTTTDEALNGMTDEELRQHVAKLQRLEVAAKEVLDYWTRRADEKVGDREAFEGVIENLVKHARKVRK